MNMDWFQIWVFVGPVILSILATILALIAGLKRWMFLCRTLLIPSILTSVIAVIFPFWLEFGDTGHGREAGLVLILPPIFCPIIFIVLYAISCGAYLIMRSALHPDKAAGFTLFDAAGLVASAIALAAYFAIVAFLIWGKQYGY
jgi:hypothetical protein